MMNPTVKAVLARCGGDATKAIRYCYDIADNYSHLRAEYIGIIDALTIGEVDAYITSDIQADVGEQRQRL